MNKKQLIAKLLEKLSEDDLVELLGDEPQEAEEATASEQQQEPTSHIHSTRSNSGNRRKGRGRSKSMANASASDRPNKKRKNQRGNKKRRGSNSGNSGKACRVLPMDVNSNRDNKFEEMIGNVSLDASEQVELSKASSSDEQARASKRNFKKPPRKSSLVDVDCCVCGDEYEISATLVQNVNRWKCNSCSSQPGW